MNTIHDDARPNVTHALFFFLADHSPPPQRSACDAVAVAVEHCPKTQAVLAAAPAALIEPWQFKEAFERGMAQEATLFDVLVASPQVRKMRMIVTMVKDEEGENRGRLRRTSHMISPQGLNTTVLFIHVFVSFCFHITLSLSFLLDPLIYYYHQSAARQHLFFAERVAGQPPKVRFWDRYGVFLAILHSTKVPLC